MKQAIVIRKDLKMERGKQISQGCHASILAYLKAKEINRKKWINQGMKKIVLKVLSKKELIELYKIAKKEKIPCELIIDKGLTQVKSGTITALGLGPDDDRKIDKITGKLKLL